MLCFIHLNDFIELSTKISVNNYETWEEFFSTKPFSEEKQILKKGLSESNLVYSIGQIYIHSSAFYSLIETSKGGAIFYETESDESIILVEDSIFNNCKAKISGGSIYKRNKGHSVLQRICGSYSQCDGSTSYEVGPFCNIFVTNENNYLKKVLESYIS